MGYTVPTSEPTEFRLGTTLKFKKYLSAYLPADGWTLTYTLVASGEYIQLVATDNGDGYHLVEVAALIAGVDPAPDTGTSTWAAGTYSWQASVTDGTDTFEVGTGTIKLLPDFAAASTGYDSRTHVKKTLDALEATLEGKASKDQMAYTIGNRAITRMSVGELLKWRDQYRSLYLQEQREEAIAAGLGSSSIVRVRF